MLLFAEIAIDVVFAAALLAALGSLIYLVTLAVCERNLRPGIIRRASEMIDEPAAPKRRSVPARARRALVHRS